MTDGRLVSAINESGLTRSALARAVGCDERTLRRWINAGAPPTPRLRHQLAKALGLQVRQLWPDLQADVDGSEPARMWAARADTPRRVWLEPLTAAVEAIDVCAYAAMFLPEMDPRLNQRLAAKAADGCRVRILLADPDSPRVAERTVEEHLQTGGIEQRIRTTLKHLAPLHGLASVQMRLFDAPMYNSVFRFDDRMLVTPHLYAIPGYQAPLVALRREAGPAPSAFDTFLGHVDRLWETAQPLTEERLAQCIAPNT